VDIRRHFTVAVGVEWDGRVPLASSEQRPEVLLNILTCIHGTVPIAKNYFAQNVNSDQSKTLLERKHNIDWHLFLCWHILSSFDICKELVP
jgi:hypothetical protein